MLHGALPRAFLAPGLSYMSYYSDEIHHPAYAAPPTTWHIPMEDPSSPIYPRIPSADHHTPLQSWESSSPPTPCPLDLSLKPLPTPKTEEMIEVGDEKDLGIRDEVHLRPESRKNSDDDQQLVVDDLDTIRSSSAQSHYERLVLSKESHRFHDPVDKIHHLPEESTRLPPYPGNEFASKYHLHNQKLLLTSPTHLQSMQGYHQHLLLTPQQQLQSVDGPMTPPSTPSPPQCPRRRVREEDLISSSSGASGASSLSTPKQANSSEKTTAQRPKKKHARRLKFDEDTSSPVSGTVILGPDEAVVTGDIDPAFNIVEVTEEARAELAKIENRLGPYRCKLCRQLHEDAFQLAQHRCSRIAHVEYRCPECDKRFSCPANLASHRRWHKPRLPNTDNSTSSTSSSSPSSSSSSSSSSPGTNGEIPCTKCEAKFTRQAALRKHLATQHSESNNNISTSNNNNTDDQKTISKPDIQTVPTSQLTSEMT